MKIVFLDKATIGNDLDFSKLDSLGEVEYYDTTKPHEINQRIRDAEVVITNKVVLGEKEFENVNKLKLICVAATGYNNIDVKAANNKGIAVCNVKGYSTNSVAQQLFAYLLAFYNKIFEYQDLVKKNRWQASEIFTKLDYRIEELTGKNLGIIGYGEIGKRVGEIAKVLGMNLLIANLRNVNYGENRIPLEEVLKNSDVLTIHVPLTDTTKNLIKLDEIRKMKKNAILVNYARGGIVNEYDLYIALRDEFIRGAIVDVLTIEPPREGNILFNAPNIFITPHTAWTSYEARMRLLDGIVSNIILYKEGKIEQIRIK